MGKVSEVFLLKNSFLFIQCNFEFLERRVGQSPGLFADNEVIHADLKFLQKVIYRFEIFVIKG